MAVVTTSTSEQAHLVKAGLGCAATWSITTVQLLQHLLGSDHTRRTLSAETERNGPKSFDVIARPAQAKRTNAAKATETKLKATVVEICDEQNTRISEQERHVLATQVVNAAIRVLGAAVQESLKTRRGFPSKDVNESARRPSMATRSSLSRSSSPASASETCHRRSQPHLFQTRALNVPSNATSKPRPSRRTSSSSTVRLKPDPYLVSVAECAQVAFASLRSRPALKTAAKGDGLGQLEDGVLAFTGSLVELGLVKVATRELKAMKRRLAAHKGQEKNSISKSHILARTKAPPQPTQESLASLLAFQNDSVINVPLPLIVNYQLLVLRVIASRRRPSEIVAALDYLQLSSANSLVNLTLRQASIAGYEVKMARKLEALVQILWSFCPSVTSSRDALAGNSKLHPPAEVVLRLQHLALEVRLMLWKVSGHQGEPDKELVEPFSRCLSAFSRRSTLPPAAKYELARKCSTEFQTSIDAYVGARRSGPPLYHITSSFLLLSKLAQAASAIQEAVDWALRHLEFLENTNATAAKVASCKINLAAMITRSGHELRPPEKGELSLVESTIQLLEGTLQGSSAELDDLLTEAISLRRAAMAWLISRKQGEKEEPNRTQSHPKRVYESVVCSSVKFALRYLGPPPPADATSTPNARYKQRRASVLRVAQSSVDSAIVCCRATIADDSASWEAVDVTMQQCFCLLNQLGSSFSCCSEQVSERATCTFVRLSNVYWAYYWRLKNGVDASQHFHSIRALQRSVAALESRSKREQELGLLSVKYEKLGLHLTATGRLLEAREAVIQAIRCQADAGVIGRAAEIGAASSILATTQDSQEVGSLCRVISTFVKVLQDSEDGHVDLCLVTRLDNLTKAEKGFILECALRSILDNTAHITTEASRSMVRPVLSDLLNIYAVEEFPLRRMRVVSLALRMIYSDDSVAVGTLPSLAEQSWITDEITDFGQDINLVRFWKHLSASVLASSALWRMPPDTSLLKKAISTWADIVSSADDWSAIVSRIDDTELWISQVEAIADFFEMQSLSALTIPTLVLLNKIAELRPGTEPSKRVANLTKLAEAYLRMGYSGKTGLLLGQARNDCTRLTVSVGERLKLHLVYAEYFLIIGKVEKSEHSLLNAKEEANDDADWAPRLEASMSLCSRVRQHKTTAEACHVQALLYLDRGSLHSALWQAKRSIELIQRVWTDSQKELSKRTKSSTASHAESPADLLVEDVGRISLESRPVVASRLQMHASLNGPKYWSLVSPLFRSLMLVSHVFARIGMLQEAVYYAEQGQGVAEAVNAAPLIAESMLALGGYYTDSCSLSRAEEHLGKVGACSQSIERSKHEGVYHFSLGWLHQSRGDSNDELDDYEKAEIVIQNLTSQSFVDSLERFPSSEQGIDAQMASLSLDDQKLRQRLYLSTKTNKSRTISKSRNPKSQVKADFKIPGANPIEACTQLRNFQGSVLRRKAMAMLLHGRLDEVTELLARADQFRNGQEGKLDQGFAVAKRLLHESSMLMTADTVWGVVADSTISIPATARDRRKTNSTTRHARPMALSPPSKSTSKSSPGRRYPPTALPRPPFSDLLQQAHDVLTEMQSLSVSVGSAAIVRRICTLLTQATILLYAAGPRNRQSVQPSLACYSLELPSVFTLQLTLSSVQVEKRPKTLEDISVWPKLTPHENDNLVIAHQFKEAFIDIIPQSWTAISIHLSEDCEEIFLSRYYADQTAFLLRIPLGRHSSHEGDEEVFGFKQGKAELLSIIELSNGSIQQTVDVKIKGAKPEWWSTREKLDSRLGDLLRNIENVWLGGFRGIFSNHPRQPELLARLHSSLQEILNKHLPSRKRPGRRTNSVAPKVQLDPRILELFIGLGDVTTEDLDISEPLLDLLYFVVDILQFNGERNAYDEVDFDAMIPEMIDALRSYHAAAAWTPISEASQQHTILILDKQLECIPWESLPCLQGLPVSRLPSLGALRQRIMQMRTNSSSVKEDDYGPQERRMEVRACSGAYVLNPGGDLGHTQNVFTGPLSALESSGGSLQSANWEGLIGQAPTSEALTQYLMQKDIFLYFGHGSGARYIRRRDVRKLGSCSPVVCLFGCSSAMLKEEGSFESWGMVASYLTAGWEDLGNDAAGQPGHEAGKGTAAVVGMLWDVTDKDCDRFAEKTLQEWGLFDATAPAVAQGLPPKTPGRRARARKEEKSVAAPTVKGKCSLSEAVARGRNACYLKYLNGAAAVVYGIPVYLR